MLSKDAGRSSSGSRTTATSARFSSGATRHASAPPWMMIFSFSRAANSSAVRMSEARSAASSNGLCSVITDLRTRRPAAVKRCASVEVAAAGLRASSSAWPSSMYTAARLSPESAPPSPSTTVSATGAIGARPSSLATLACPVTDELPAAPWRPASAPGLTSAKPMPSARLTVTGIESGLNASEGSNSGRIWPSLSDESIVVPSSDTSATPSDPTPPNSAGVTGRPCRSITVAPSGAVTPGPTAVMRPPTISTLESLSDPRALSVWISPCLRSTAVSASATGATPASTTAKATPAIARTSFIVSIVARLMAHPP